MIKSSFRSWRVEIKNKIEKMLTLSNVTVKDARSLAKKIFGKEAKLRYQNLPSHMRSTYFVTFSGARINKKKKYGMTERGNIYNKKGDIVYISKTYDIVKR